VARVCSCTSTVISVPPTCFVQRFVRMLLPMLTAVPLPARTDWTVRDSQAPNYFKTTLESISRDDKLGLVSSHIHLTGVAPDQANDLRFIIARVRTQRLN